MPKRITIGTTEELEDCFEDFIRGDDVRGVITLPFCCMNIMGWKQRTGPALSLVTGVSQRDLEKLVYYDAGLVTEPKASVFREGQIVLNKDLKDFLSRTHDLKKIPVCVWGADAIRFLLNKVDLREKYGALREEEQKLMKYKECVLDFGETDSKGNYSDKDREIVQETENKLVFIRAQIDAVMKLNEMEKTQGALFIQDIRLFPCELGAHIREMAKTAPYGIRQVKEAYKRVVLYANRYSTNINHETGRTCASAFADNGLMFDASFNSPLIWGGLQCSLQQAVDSLLCDGIKREQETEPAGNAFGEKANNGGPAPAHSYMSLVDVMMESVSLV